MQSKAKSRRAGKVLSCLFLNMLLFASFVMLYINNTWDSISINEIVFHATHSLEGVSTELIFSCLMQTALPMIICNVIYIYIGKYIQKINIIVYMIIISLFMILTVISIINLKIFNYIIHGNTISNFINDHYVDPDNVEITFKEKRNLIYIYVESMESSFSDRKHGGYFDENLIPNLTRLTEENITKRSGETINGAYSPTGTTWTTAGVFAQSTGLPLLIPIQHNSMDTQKEFFPSITGIGDILDKNMYYQEVIMGIHASFSGLNAFFKDHGGAKIIDYQFMHDNGLIPTGYKSNSWGIDDGKLLEIAKNRILSASKRETPFNISIMTFDMHFDLKINQYCHNNFNNEYKNIIFCSDKLIYSFVDWIKEQEFYKNTTIVISGDHPSMKRNVINNKKYIRKTYNTYINTYKSYKINNDRQYSQFDIFPTTLSAIGAEISGDRIGLGTNLFGDTKTLSEIYGYEYIDHELSKKSSFFADKMKFNLDLINNPGYELYGSSIEAYAKDKKTIHLEVNLSNLDPNWLKADSYDILPDINYHKPLLAYIYQDDSLKTTKLIKMKQIEPKIYSTDINFSKFLNDKIFIQFFCQCHDGTPLLVGVLNRHKNFVNAKNFKDYTDKIKIKKYSIFINIYPSNNKEMTKDLEDGLRNLGLKSDFPYNFLLAYCAVIDGGKITEKVSTNIMSSGIEILGNLVSNSNISYVVQSDNYNVVNFGAHSSINISNNRCSKTTPGLNIVVYDNELKKVVDSTTF